MKEINESIICAGFGGQGMMLLGKVLVSTGMEKGLNVTWFPSYGAEVRGGTAHSMVRISAEHIPSPIVLETDTAIIMNGPSLNKFSKKVVPGGLAIINSSMASEKVKRDDITVIEAPLSDEAIKLGNVKVANMIAAGIYAAIKDIFSEEELIKVIQSMGRGNKKLIDINVEAARKGTEIGSRR